MSARNWKSLVAILICLPLFGCSDTEIGANVSDSGDPGERQPAVTTSSLSELYLPNLSGRSCESDQEEPKVCEWTASMDAVLWGRIESVELSKDWRVRGDDGFDLVEECSLGTVALQVTLDVTDVLYGDEIPTEVTFSIGGGILDDWIVQPKENGEGGMDWKMLGAEQADEDPPFVDGERLGVALHRVEESESWSTVGEPLFLEDEVEENDETTTIVKFQKPRFESECLEFPQPEEFEGMKTSQFSDMLAKCDENEAATERKDAIEALEFDDPANLFAGLCFDAGSSSDSDCVADSDCGSDEVCVDGQCKVM